MTKANRLKKPTLTFFAQLNISLGEPLEIGIGRSSIRRIIPILGGNFKGPTIEGEILNLGADWQTVFDTEISELDTRYALKTQENAIIEIVNKGFRHGPKRVMERLAAGENIDPSKYSMTTQATLETGHPKYEWVNKQTFIGTGARFKSKVVLDLYFVS